MESDPTDSSLASFRVETRFAILESETNLRAYRLFISSAYARTCALMLKSLCFLAFQQACDLMNTEFPG